MKRHVIAVAACLVASFTQAAPCMQEQLFFRVVVSPCLDVGAAANTTYNPRLLDNEIYASQITTPCFGRYQSDSGALLMAVNNTGIANGEHRIVAPFRGAFRSSYILGSSSGAGPTTAFSRYDFDGRNRVETPVPDGQTAEGFDWVNDHTIIFTCYVGSGNRKRLYLADVTAEPFAVTKNTTWNADGYVTTSVSTRIRNVRVGDVYSGYAYYGDAGQNSSPNFYALHLATGAETLLGNAGPLTGGNSFGLWTVLERGGFLYVQTTDNGIQVYQLNSATSLGPLYLTYTKTALDALTGIPAANQYYGLDVSQDQTKLVLGSALGKVFEVGPPVLAVCSSGTDVILSWPASITGMVIQSASDLTTGFADLDPQPVVTVNGHLNTATVSASPDNSFFRLRKTP